MIEKLQVFRETFPLYYQDFDIVPNRLNSTRIDNIVDLVSKELTSTDEYVQLGAKEELQAIATTTSPINRSKIFESMTRIKFFRNNSIKYSITLIKLILHISSPYSDSEYIKQISLYRNISSALSCELTALFPIESVVLSGSLVNPQASLWHPYFSDIDIIPISTNVSDTSIIESLQEWYKSNSPQKYIYVNYGAKKDLGGINKEPLSYLFNIQGLSTLNLLERSYLCELFRHGYILLSGNPLIPQRYFKSTKAVQNNSNLTEVK